MKLRLVAVFMIDKPLSGIDELLATQDLKPHGKASMY